MAIKIIKIYTNNRKTNSVNTLNYILNRDKKELKYNCLNTIFILIYFLERIRNRILSKKIIFWFSK